MMNLFSSFAFLNPWILTGLLALPALWLLLRITPPAAKIIILPTTRFLKDLIPDQQTPSRTPLWLLILRIFIAALLLLALAQPVLNPSTSLPGTGPVRIVMDNSWPSAQTWDLQMGAAQEILSAAQREDRNAIIMTTAAMEGQTTPYISNLMSATEAQNALRSLKPLPWAPDYNAAASQIKTTEIDNITTYWFSAGLYEDGINNLAGKFKSQGSLTYFTPPPEKLPVALKRTPDGLMLAAPLETPPGRKITVQALDENGRVLDEQILTTGATEKLQAGNAMQGKLASYRITGEPGAGGVYLIDDLNRKRDVGIVAPSDDAAAKPFIEERYYLARALEPYTTLHLGTIDELVKKNPSLIILPDIGNLPPQSLDALTAWVKQGGTLLRFSGPQMAESTDSGYLTPVPLRLSSRSMNGALTWEEPAKLKEFSTNGPLAGITISDPITIATQILAEPSDKLDEKTWARLEDGTPLITGAPFERGLLVFVHTTASPLWSDLALSGTYVEILRRVIALSGQTQNTQILTDGTLQPVWMLDGYGRKQKPGSGIKPITASDFETTPISAINPPGIYAIGSIQKALNLADKIDILKTASNIEHTIYGDTHEKDLMPYLLFAAMMLLLFDWVIMISLYGNLKFPRKFASVLLFCLMLIPAPSSANEAQDIEYGDAFYLAYIRSGDSATDSLTQTGLENLAKTLTQRTSVEPAGVVGIDLTQDQLLFFPIIYWPITPQQQTLPTEMLIKLQNYLDHGGTILIDTRGQTANLNLRSLIGPLNVPPLHPIPEDHVLKRSFYLLNNLPGRYTNNDFWVEEKSMSGRDDVSSILIGSNDWAAAWAAANPTGGTGQGEMSLRFGVNLVIYALTGNYKSDQIHLPHILERLGQ